MKGAVDLITLIIVACMVVSIGLMLWFYLSTYYWQVTRSGENSTAKSLETLSSCMRVEEAAKNNFFIRNCGTGLITNSTLSVYVDDNIFSFNLTPVSIDAGKTGTLALQGAWGLSASQHTLRVTNPNVETSALFDVGLPDSCVLDLEFDEGSGNIAYDKSGYGNNCTLNGATWSAGKYWYGLKFDGNYHDANCGNDASIRDITDAITLAAWVKFDSIPTPVQQQMNWISKLRSWRMGVSSSSAAWFETYWSTDYIWTATPPAIIQPGIWYYIVSSYDKNSPNYFTKLYVNGLENYTPPGYQQGLGGNHLLNVSDNNVFIGSDGVWAYFNGTVDNVRIFTKSLTPDQTLNFRLI